MGEASAARGQKYYTREILRMDYIMNTEGGEYAQYIVQELNYDPLKNSPPEFQEMYKKFSRRILWIDGNHVPGAFQMNTAWYFNVPERDPIFNEHVHEDTKELIGFIGTDMDDPYELGGTIEFSIEGEPHLLTRSTMIFVPAGLKHNPMRILEVNRPIFHFSVVMKEIYDGEAVYR